MKNIPCSLKDKITGLEPMHNIVSSLNHINGFEFYDMRRRAKIDCEMLEDGFIWNVFLHIDLLGEYNSCIVKYE